jgi:hypothetical protein
MGRRSAVGGRHGEIIRFGRSSSLIPRARRHGPCRSSQSACKTAARLTAEDPLWWKGNPMFRLPVQTGRRTSADRYQRIHTLGISLSRGPKVRGDFHISKALKRFRENRRRWRQGHPSTYPGQNPWRVPAERRPSGCDCSYASPARPCAGQQPVPWWPLQAPS